MLPSLGRAGPLQPRPCGILDAFEKQKGCQGYDFLHQSHRGGTGRDYPPYRGGKITIRAVPRVRDSHTSIQRRGDTGEQADTQHAILLPTPDARGARAGMEPQTGRY